MGTTLVAPWHFCQRCLILVWIRIIMRNGSSTIVGRVHADAHRITARVLTKCPRVSLNTFCAATCSNLYHISHTHPVQIALRFHFINGSRSPAPQQSEEIRRKEMRLCRSPHNTRASESHYADTQRDWPDIAVAIAEAHHRSHSRQPRRALLQHGQQ